MQAAPVHPVSPSRAARIGPSLRTSAFAPAFLLASVLLTAPGCVTTTEPKKAEGEKAMVTPKLPETRSDDTLAKIGRGAMTVPENVVWIPWKMIGGGFKGAVDGVEGGFTGTMPALGFVFSPVNAAVGFVTGFVQGAVLPPALIGPNDDFGRTMALPTRQKTSLWWYE